MSLREARHRWRMKMYSEAAFWLAFALIAGSLIWLLVGCEQGEPRTRAPILDREEVASIEEGGPAWRVQRVATFYAGYEDRRRDVLTLISPEGKRWIVVTGCAIDEWTYETTVNVPVGNGMSVPVTTIHREEE